EKNDGDGQRHGVVPAPQRPQEEDRQQPEPEAGQQIGRAPIGHRAAVYSSVEAAPFGLAPLLRGRAPDRPAPAEAEGGALPVAQAMPDGAAFTLRLTPRGGC